MTFCLFEHTAPGPACQPIISILPRCKGAPPVLCLEKKERGPEPVIFVRPDFYDDFACIASRCRHSCCVGWEIDIDSDALARWETIGGALGEKMRRSIAREPAPHFVLTKGERCPLLRADGLCELILSEGEDSLCDICASHPRFYQEYPDRLEAGLGLCCEEAVCLLLAETGPLRLTADGDEGDALSPTPLLRQRGKLFAILADEAACLSDRMACCLSRYGRVLTPFDPRAASDFLLTLERMDEAWTALLQRLAAEGTAELEPQLSAGPYGRLAAYFLYRHFAAGGEEEAGARLTFALFAARLLCAMAAYAPLEDAVRLFSAEIEYSDENVEKLLNWLA